MPHFEVSAVTVTLLQIGAIILVSRLIGVVTRRLGQPMVIAEVTGGILLGPSLLGWLWPAGMRALFPESSLGSLKMLSQVGLVLFMFLVGLELNPKLLKGRAPASVAISHTSIALPFALGAGLAFFLHQAYAPAGVGVTAFTLFLGAAMSVTAFPVLARILSERRLLNSRVGAITIACAAVDDVTAWCILAFVVAVGRAEGVSQALWTTGMAIAFILGMLYVARPFLRRLGERVASRDGLTPPVIAATLLLLLASSAVTEMIGVHALFGAFLFGAVLPKDGKLAETLADKLETVAVVLLLPLFFAYSGLRTEIGLIDGPREWAVAALVIVLATVGKFGGSAVAARLTGIRWREASAIGILMNTRGLMELIVLNVGMDIGVISPELFTIMVVMALVTTAATSPVLRLVYPDDELARDQLSIEGAPVATPMPVAQVAAPTFGVLMCVSDARVGPGLATVAAALAGKAHAPAELHALHVWHPSDRPSVDLRRDDPDSADSPLAPLLADARRRDLRVRPLSFASSEPADEIRRVAEHKRASIVLLGAHKPLLLEGRLDGMVSKIVAEAPCPVGVLIDRGLDKVERVLVAYAGGPEDLAAIRLARRLAATPGIELTLFHVAPPADAPDAGSGRAQIEAEDIEGVHVRVVEHPSPPDAVLEEARRGYDLVVLGMHARWGVGAGLISRKRRRVLAEAPVSILAVHPPVTAAAAEVVSESEPALAGSPTG